MLNINAKKLNPIADERGFLMEIFRSDDKLFEQFGQAYVTSCYPGIVKGWHKHEKQTDNFCCIKGMIKLVITDGKYYKELFIGERNPLLVQIPPGLWHGFKAIGKKEALVLNIPTLPYNSKKPDEQRKHKDFFDKVYKWEIHEK